MPIFKSRFFSRRRSKKWINPFSLKKYFLIKSPYFEYSKKKLEDFATNITPRLNSNVEYPEMYTPVTKSVGKIPTHEKILNRSIETYAPDVMPVKEEFHHNIINLKIYNISMKQHAETEFNGFRLTKEKLSSLPHKFHSLITLNQVYKSLDGYQVRIMMSASTRPRILQLKKSSYANKSQIKKIRTVMHQCVEKHISKMKIHDFVLKMAVKCEMSKEILQKCENIYPLSEEILITKIKVLERPPREDEELMFIH